MNSIHPIEKVMNPVEGFMLRMNSIAERVQGTKNDALELAMDVQAYAEAVEANMAPSAGRDELLRAAATLHNNLIAFVQLKAADSDVPEKPRIQVLQ